LLTVNFFHDHEIHLTLFANLSFNYTHSDLLCRYMKFKVTLYIFYILFFQILVFSISLSILYKINYSSIILNHEFLISSKDFRIIRFLLSLIVSIGAIIAMVRKCITIDARVTEASPLTPKLLRQAWTCDLSTFDKVFKFYCLFYVLEQYKW
jgi:hypothetical protein